MLRPTVWFYFEIRRHDFRKSFPKFSRQAEDRWLTHLSTKGLEPKESKIIRAGVAAEGSLRANRKFMATPSSGGPRVTALKWNEPVGIVLLLLHLPFDFPLRSALLARSAYRRESPASPQKSFT